MQGVSFPVPITIGITVDVVDAGAIGITVDIVDAGAAVFAAVVAAISGADELVASPVTVWLAGWWCGVWAKRIIKLY